MWLKEAWQAMRHVLRLHTHLEPEGVHSMQCTPLRSNRATLLAGLSAHNAVVCTVHCMSLPDTLSTAFDGLHQACKVLDCTYIDRRGYT